MGEYLFKIRRMDDYTLDDLLNDRVNASIATKFDDKSECQFNYDVDKICNKIFKQFGRGLSEDKYLLLFENYKDHRKDKKGLKKLLIELIKPEEVPFKRNFLISCMSNLNFVNNNHMWNQYTKGNPSEGILIVYSKNNVINNCKKNNVLFGDIDYSGRNSSKLDLTEYWYDWLMSYMETTDYSKTTGNRVIDMVAQMAVTGRNLASKGKKYINDNDLIFVKDKNWKYQQEYRLAKENASYNRFADLFSKGNSKYDEYGYTILEKPVAIYIRKGIDDKIVKLIEEFAGKDIEIYYEENNDSKQFYDKYH